MNPSQLINQTSGDVEYYTPVEIVNAARDVMGGIDLDPASSAAANERVRATTFFTREDDGLAQRWSGRVWMNHPFGKSTNRAWIKKLVDEYAAENIAQACCITFAATSERWFQPLLQYPQCFLCPRTDYYLPDGTKKRGVTKGSVVTYLGERRHEFRQAFSRFGVVK